MHKFCHKVLKKNVAVVKLIAVKKTEFSLIMDPIVRCLHSHMFLEHTCDRSCSSKKWG
jgi:hypothetical protein